MKCVNVCVRELPSHSHREHNSNHILVINQGVKWYKSLNKQCFFYLFIAIMGEEINIVTLTSGGRGKTVFQDQGELDRF